VWLHRFSAEGTLTTCPAWPGRRRKPSSKEKRRPAPVSSGARTARCLRAIAPLVCAEATQASRRGGGNQPAAGGSGANRDRVRSVRRSHGSRRRWLTRGPSFAARNDANGSRRQRDGNRWRIAVGRLETGKPEAAVQIADEKGCSPPYTIDVRSGKKAWKLECL